MPIQQALQLAYAQQEQRMRDPQFRRGSDQILGQHLVPILQWERVTLGLQNPAELRSGLTANPLQFVFQCASFLGRHCSTLLG